MLEKKQRNRKRKYEVNDNFFISETEESFYVAGFIASDGCIYKNEICIKLSTNDKKHLEKINRLLKSNRPIRDYNNEYSGASVLRVSSKQLIKDLKKFNIVPCKSLTYEFPDWLKEHSLKHHFMRGYFDGDGSFYLNKQYNEKVCFGLRGTEKFLLDYRSILEKECGFEPRKNKMPISSKCYQLGYGGNRNIVNITNFIYKDATVFLERKKNIALLAKSLKDNLYVQKD